MASVGELEDRPKRGPRSRASCLLRRYTPAIAAPEEADDVFVPPLKSKRREEKMYFFICAGGCVFSHLFWGKEEGEEVW